MIDARGLEELLVSDRQDVLSVSINVDPTRPEHQRDNPAYRIWARRALSETLTQAHRDRRAEVGELVGRVLNRIDDRQHGCGLAIFAAPHLWREYVLPFPLPNRVRYGRPDVLPLLWAVDEYQAYAILAVDHEHALLLKIYLGRTAVLSDEIFELDTHDWSYKSSEASSFARRAGIGIGRSTQRDVFEARVDAQVHRFWRGAADGTAQALRDLEIERLIVAGPVEATAAVRDLLAPPLRQRVVSTLSLPSSASVADIRDRTLPAALEVEHQKERALVAEVLERAAAETGGVVGLPVTLAALQRGRVHIVVADVSRDPEIWRCRECGAVSSLERSACPICAGATERTTLMEVLPLLVRRKGARLELVSGEAAALLVPHDGIAACLRY